MQALNAEQLEQHLRQDPAPLLINVLAKKHFEQQHIPGSVNLPVEQEGFAQTVEQLAGDKHAPIIVYCANAACSSSHHAAQKLEDAGFTKVFDFEAGTEGWRQAGHELAGRQVTAHK